MLAAVSAPHSVVDHKSQMGRCTRQLDVPSLVSPDTALTCRGLRAPVLSRTAGGRCIGRQRRRLVAVPSRQASRRIFTHAARGGRIGELRYAARLSAKFVRAVMAARSQLRTPKHIDCQVTYRSECHFVQRLSAFVGFNTDEHSERHHGTVLYKPRNLHEQQGARQHECR